jgi:acetolactate synthase-1/2/3 large subunit
MAENKVRVADFIAQFLADYGIKHVFLVTGGGAMHLNDAFAKESRITPIFNHHEQACAMGAEGYARVTNKLAVINVTTGPGGLNALNGVFGAYTDSIPMLILSGQVKRETKKESVAHLNLRQLGDQEVDIVSVAKPITKNIVSLEKPEDVKYELQKAIHLATSGRYGPVWIDIPVDVQGSLVDVDQLREYSPEINRTVHSSSDINLVIEKLKSSKRPVILVGNGVRLSNSIDELFKVAEVLKVPICAAWMMDFLPSDYEYFCGIQGTIGDRAGNFVVQNSDFLLILGSRLQIRQVSYNWENFARQAYKVHVDIDSGELNKPTMKSNLKIQSDIKIFLNSLIENLRNYTVSQEHKDWLLWAKDRKKKYSPVVQEKHRIKNGKINPYYFFEILSKYLNGKWNVIAGNATACVMSFPTIELKKGMRMFTNAGSASMGYDLPAAIGAALADQSRNTLCIAGDGSIMMNLQELQTVVQMNLPLKILVINNNGYLSIRSTQVGFFGRPYGESSKSGILMPDFVALGNAFGIRSFKVDQIENVNSTLEQFLAYPHASLMEVVVDEIQPFEPKLSSKKMADGKMVSAPLEDMFPFLERPEFLSNMIVEPMEVSKK